MKYNKDSKPFTVRILVSEEIDMNMLSIFTKYAQEKNDIKIYQWRTLYL